MAEFRRLGVTVQPVVAAHQDGALSQLKAQAALAAAVNAEAFGDDTYSADVGACGLHADRAQVAEAADAVRAAVPTIVVLRQAADSLAVADHVHRV
jgi:hypothetical protein